MKDFMITIAMTIVGYLRADWYILLVGILLAVSITVYVDTKKLRRFFERNARISIPGAVAFGALTPLCACGTTAVMLSMFISSMPWGTVMAFMISSPLTSPSEYLFETAFLGSRVATGVLVSSVLLGILAGGVAHLLEKKTKFFENQFRLNGKKNKDASDGTQVQKVSSRQLQRCRLQRTGLKQEAVKVDRRWKAKHHRAGFMEKYKIKVFMKELYNTGLKKILLYFILFIAVGKIVEMAVPKEWIMGLFSSGKFYSIPLAATIGLPLYLTDSSAIPLLKSFINSGAGEGAVIAFLIAGKATGIPVMAGLATIFKKRAMGFYLGFIYLGAILAGYVYQTLIYNEGVGIMLIIIMVLLIGAGLILGKDKNRLRKAEEEFCRIECKGYDHV